MAMFNVECLMLNGKGYLLDSSVWVHDLNASLLFHAASR